MLVVSFITFILLRLTPGDTIMAKVAAGGLISPERLAKMRRELGLDEPLLVQYARWMGGVLHGDFGQSFTTSRPTLSQFFSAAPVTLELGLIALITGILFGVMPARRAAALDPVAALGRR